MISDALTQLGIGGILVILVLDKVFTFLKTRGGMNSNGANQTIRYNIQKVHDFTIEQRQISRQLTETQKNIADTMQKQVILLERISDKQTTIADGIEKMVARG